MTDLTKHKTYGSWIAIDIANDSNVVMVETVDGNVRRFRMANSGHDHERLVALARSLPQPCRIGFEATGNYHRTIDDFGTGYSSLGYLKNLPIDKVKIDRSFVNDVILNSADAAIVHGIISMAHHLGLKVVAEGVETQAQFSFLRRNNCDFFQGYLFARPMPLHALIDMLTQKECRLLPAEPRPESGAERVLLLVDDEKNVLSALTRLLRRDGYRIITAQGPVAALELLAKHPVQVIVSDQRMAEMNGTEFFARVKTMYPDTVRLILSGYTDLKSVTEAVNHGAIYKYITKPWDDEALREDIKAAFRKAAANAD